MPGAVPMIWRGGKPAHVVVVGRRGPAQAAPLFIDPKMNAGPRGHAENCSA
jgi:hypothetical protein